MKSGLDASDLIPGQFGMGFKLQKVNKAHLFRNHDAGDDLTGRFLETHGITENSSRTLFFRFCLSDQEPDFPFTIKTGRWKLVRIRRQHRITRPFDEYHTR